MDNRLADIATALGSEKAALGDVLVRLYDPRFGIYLPHEDAAKARTAADRLRKVIESLKIKHQFSPAGPALTASAGVISLASWQGNRAETSGGNVTLAQKK